MRTREDLGMGWSVAGRTMRAWLGMRLLVGVMWGLMGAMVAGGLVGCGNSTPPSSGTPAEASSAEGKGGEAAPSRVRETSARIVAHSPALAVTLTRMGYADRIVGRHAHDVILSKDIPSCGEMGTIDYEALVKTNPTHVFIQWGSQALPPKLIDLAERNRWVLVNYDLLTLDQVLDSAEDMARRLREHEINREELGLPRGESVAGSVGVRQRTSRAWAARAWEPQRAGRVLLLGSIDPPVAIGPGSFHHQMLVSMGGTPALTQGTPWMPMDVEDIAKLNPDAILIFSPAAGAVEAEGAVASGAGRGGERPVDALRGAMFEEIKDRLGRLGNSPIKAVQEGKVALIDDPLCMIPALSLADIAGEMSKVLEAWAWPKGLPEEFKLLPVDDAGGGTGRKPGSTTRDAVPPEVPMPGESLGSEPSTGAGGQTPP